MVSSLTRLALVVLGSIALLATGAADDLATAFTYQGDLQLSEGPASGPFDFEFRLFDAEVEGDQIGDTVAVADVDVRQGRFSVELDFGPVFGGNSLWLEVAVRRGELEGPFTTLSPRSPVRPTPYALYAATAGEAATLGGFSADDFLDKDTYDADRNAKVDAAEHADRASDADRLGGHESDDFLLRSGGQMEGPLFLANPPYISSEAATKGYVDSMIGGGGSPGSAIGWIFTDSKTPPSGYSYSGDSTFMGGQSSFLAELPADDQRESTAWALIGDKVLLIGGSELDQSTGFPPTRRVDVFDISSGQWRAGPSLLEPMTGASACSTPDGAIFVHRHNHAEVLDPGASAWRRLPDSPFEREARLLCTVEGPIVFGSYEYPVIWDRSVVRFDRAAEEWRVLSSLPFPEFDKFWQATAAEVLGGDFLVVFEPNYKNVLPILLRFSPNSAQWQVLGTLGLLTSLSPPLISYDGDLLSYTSSRDGTAVLLESIAGGRYLPRHLNGLPRIPDHSFRALYGPNTAILAYGSTIWSLDLPRRLYVHRPER